jgi:hypothetical protein
VPVLPEIARPHIPVIDSMGERERDAANRVATHQCHCIKIIFVLGVDSCRCSSQAKKSFSQKSFVGNPCPAEMGVSPLSEEKILQI